MSPTKAASPACSDEGNMKIDATRILALLLALGPLALVVAWKRGRTSG